MQQADGGFFRARSDAMQAWVNVVSHPLVFWTVTGLIGLFGFLAVMFPHRFTSVARSSATWVDTSHVLSVLDRRVEVDGAVLRHPRAFGLFLLTGLAVFVCLVVLR
jgi:hypothetical protein